MGIAFACEHYTVDDTETNPMSLENMAKEKYMGKVKGKLSLFTNGASVTEQFQLGKIIFHDYFPSDKEKIVECAREKKKHQ